MGWWSDVKERGNKMAEEYGTIWIVTYLTSFVITFTAFYVALMNGFEVGSAAGTAGIVAGAYAATKATMFVRLPLSIAVTPFIAKVLERRKSQQA
ncbi:MAG: FAM210 family protein [Myxococcales bacterium]|nr:FAM210 family protein [Myxococcales bacterium]